MIAIFFIAIVIVIYSCLVAGSRADDRMEELIKEKGHSLSGL